MCLGYEEDGGVVVQTRLGVVKRSPASFIMQTPCVAVTGGLPDPRFFGGEKVERLIFKLNRVYLFKLIFF